MDAVFSVCRHGKRLLSRSGARYGSAPSVRIVSAPVVIEGEIKQRGGIYMRKTGFALLAGLLVLSIAAGGWAAEPPSWQTSSLVEETATVVAVDQSTRMVTLKGPKGNSVTFKASDEVRNLAQVKVGDEVRFGYYESLDVRVLKEGEAFPASGESSAMVRAKPGEKPGGSRGDGDERQRHDHGHRQEGEDRDPEGGGREVRDGETVAPGETRRGQGGGPPGDHVHGGGRGEGGEGGKEV